MTRILTATLAAALVLAPGLAMAEPDDQPATEAATASAPTTLAASGSALVERDDDGLMIDWTRFTLRIKGIGVAPERGTLVQRRTLAKRTAFADGYRRAADAIDQLRVNSEAYVRDLTAVDDASRLGVNELVRSAKALNVDYWADGSVEVTFELPMGGTDGLTRVLFGASAVASDSVSPKGKPSGLVIDARGTGAQPALRPRVRDAAGKVFVPEESPVAYFHQTESLKDWVGDSPVRVKAKRAYGTTHADVLLSDDETNHVKGALKDGRRLPIAIIL